MENLANPISQFWENRERMPPRPMPKIIRKIPFEKMVQTERNEVWGYIIVNGKPLYHYFYAFFMEQVRFTPEERLKYALKQPAVIKSINRNKNKR